jgi:lipoprotein NlpD
MNCSKYLWPMVFASLMAGCSFTGGNAPISDGSATASVYTVKPGDTLYAISSRYGLDPAVVARENHLTNPSHLLVGQKLRLSVSSSTDANIRRVEANTKTQTSSSSSAKSSTSSSNTQAASSSTSVGSANGTYGWPASGKIIQNFGGMNKGIDIAGSEGEKVHAAVNGTVLFDGQVQGYGKVVMIRDKDGCVSVYGRVKSITVKQGDQVRKGQAIAVMGTTDVSPRVHFEIRKNGKPIDPLTMLQKR